MEKKESQDLTYREALKKRVRGTSQEQAKGIKEYKKATRALEKVLERLPQTPPDEVLEMVDQSIREKEDDLSD